MKRKLISLLSILVVGPALMVGSSLGWFAEAVQVEIDNLEGDIFTGYFYSGTGTEKDPFTITRPVHYYNMVSLIEYSDEFAGKYYQIGAKLESSDDSLKVFNYDDDGHPIETDGNKYSYNLNMKGTPVHTIGSEVHPFIGSLNGSNLTISNIQVSAEGFSDVGIFGYVGEEASVKNLYFNGVTIDTNGLVASNDDASENHTAHADNTAHCGYLAGHIEAAESFENVYVNDCQLAGENTTANLKIANDWGYYGHCENAKGLADFVKRVRGDTPGFGGSIGMDNVYKRISNFANNSVQDYVISGEYHYFNNNVEDTSKYKEITTTFDSYEYFDEDEPLKGRLVCNESQTFLWGKRHHEVDYTITNEIHKDTDAVCYYLKSENNYFRGTASIGRTQTESRKTLLFSDADGWVYYTYNNNRYYLYASSSTNGTLRTSTSEQNYMFKVDGNNLRLYKVSDGTSYDRFVRYSGTSFSINGTKSNILVQTTDYKTETIVDHVIDYETNGSFIPLNVYNSTDEITDEEKAKIAEQGLTATVDDLYVNGAKLNNTGYIVGGTKGTGTHDSGVRIAENYNYTDLHVALGNSSNTNSYTASKLQVLTRTKDSGGVVYINDTFNSETALTTSQTALSYLSSETKVDVADLGLKMYTKARAGVDEIFKANPTKLYVMRFNEFNVDINNTVTAEKVLLNGNVKENYVFPESCVDFNLAEKGSINFFGGGFRGGTCDAFFSLYHVIRDENETMKSLKRLSKIYGKVVNDKEDKKAPYIYQYIDNTYSIYDANTKTYKSTSLLEGYEEFFQLAWVEEPGFTKIDNTCWYFEIPVNEGEYALGSAVNTKSSTGAYMFYLDVGSNGDIEEADKTDDFGPVEYRDTPDTVEDTILLITYTQPANSVLTLTIDYDKNKYGITMTCNMQIEVKITLLSDEYSYTFNNDDAVAEIGTYTYTIKTTT